MGGLLGLGIGFSLLSLTEILYFFGGLRSCFRRRRQESVRPFKPSVKQQPQDSVRPFNPSVKQQPHIILLDLEVV